MEPKSDHFPTRSSLLRRAKDTGDHRSWQEFHDVYRGLIFAFARKAGLNEDEASEVVQETLISASRHLPSFQYNPKICAFKTWLLNLAQWRVKDQLRKRASGPPSRPDTFDDEDRTATVERVPDPSGERLEAVWDEEWRSAWLQAALANVRQNVDPKQWQIFDLYALKEWTPGDVARALHVSVARVYLVKHRVSARLKAEMKRLEKLADGAGPSDAPPSN